MCFEGGHETFCGDFTLNDGTLEEDRKRVHERLGMLRPEADQKWMKDGTNRR